LTLEEGAPLSQPERQEMPGGDGIWLYPEAGFRVLLENAGFQPRRVEDYTAAHAGVAQRLAGAFEQDQAASRGILIRRRRGKARGR
jgi:hypothetical protein